jgi:hypothetical protein
MKKFFLPLILATLFVFHAHALLQTVSIGEIPTSNTPETPGCETQTLTFTPPVGWHLVDISSLSSTVQTMVVGKGQYPYPPSMNLTTEPYAGTLKQYLKIIKAMNDSLNHEWKDLGWIETKAGRASLSQVDSQTEWGNVRLMHVVLLKNGRIYILTASALKDEFTNFYKDFFNSMKSLSFAAERSSG